jgi:colanic acid biosynthesis protein WcaH
MDVVDEHVPDDQFVQFVSSFPQVSVELVVEHRGRILLTRRTQEPAKDEWFWPGSRLYKGERFEDAVARVAREELGVSVDRCCQLGTYAHFWETDVFDAVESKHTVNVVYHVSLDDPAELDLDYQHDELRFVDPASPGADLHPHVETYLRDLVETHPRLAE